MATKEQLDLGVKLLEEMVKAHPDLGAVAARAKAALQEFDAATTAHNAADADRLAKEIDALVLGARTLVTARSAAPAASSEAKWWPYIGMFVLVGVLIALGVLLGGYATGIGAAKLATIEGTRPLLVMAAIVSTIAFGGALLMGSLFSSEGTFEERFRHAREIFLVFSGVFGTVIGFYFGASESHAPQLGIEATLQAATVVAHVTGGTSPYKVTATYGPNSQTKTLESKDGWVRFTFDAKTDHIAPFKLSVTDAKNVQGSKSIDFTREELKANGWPDAPAAPAKPPAAPPAAPGASGASPPATNQKAPASPAK